MRDYRVRWRLDGLVAYITAVGFISYLLIGVR